MDMNKLKYFLAVAQTENITVAAKHLSITQPALTRSLHRFEDELDVKLFAREGRNIKLTPEGAYLQDRTIEPMKALDKANEDMHAFAKRLKTTIRICIMSASVLAVDAIANYSATHPDAAFEVTQDPNSAFSDIIISSEARPNKTSATFQERIGIAASLSTNKPPRVLNLSDLKNANFISLAESSKIRKQCDNLCSKHNFKPHVVFESDNPSVVRKMIGLGMGVGFWPERSWGDLDESCMWIPLSSADFQRTVVVSLTEQGINKASARKFKHYLEQYLETYWNSDWKIHQRQYIPNAPRKPLTHS